MNRYDCVYSGSDELLNRPMNIVSIFEYDGGKVDLYAFSCKMEKLSDGFIIVDCSDNDVIVNHPKLLLYIKSEFPVDRYLLLQKLSNIITTEWVYWMKVGEEFDSRFCNLKQYVGAKNINRVAFQYGVVNNENQYYVLKGSDNGFFSEERMWRMDTIHRTGNFPIVKSDILFYKKMKDECQFGEIYNVFTKSYDKQSIYWEQGAFQNYEQIEKNHIERLILHKLDVIGNYFLLKKKMDEHIGLYSGEGGIILCLAQYYLRTKKSCYLEKMNVCLKDLEEKIENSQKIVSSFCDGIAGICWLLCYLKDNGLVDIDKDYFDDFDEILKSHIKLLERERHFDQMHGMISIGRYFLKRDKEAELKEILTIIAKAAIWEENEVKWVDKNPLRPLNYDFGLAHGMAGILYFILKCYQKRIYPELCLKMGNGIVNFYQHNEQNCDEKGFYFPYKIAVDSYFLKNRSAEQCRYAWCYGDVSIFYILYLYAISTENKELEKVILNKLCHTTMQKDCGRVVVKDAQFCHGASGLVQLYHRLYLHTQKEIFKDATLYWLRVLLTMGNANSDTGYIFLVHNGYEKKWIQNNTLLEGISGVGLTLSSIIRPDYIMWDEAMMLC